jgi:hypothetical protein
LLPKNRGQFIGKCFSVVEKLGNENEGQGFWTENLESKLHHLKPS